MLLTTIYKKEAFRIFSRRKKPLAQVQEAEGRYMNHVQRQAEKEVRREAMEDARVWGVSPWMFQPILRQSVRKWLLLSVRIFKRAQGLYGIIA